MNHIDNIREIKKGKKPEWCNTCPDCLEEGYLKALNEFKKQFDNPAVLIQDTRDNVEEAIKEADK